STANHQGRNQGGPVGPEDPGQPRASHVSPGRPNRPRVVPRQGRSPVPDRPDLATREMKPAQEGSGKAAFGEPRISGDLSEATFSGSPDFEGSASNHAGHRGAAKSGPADGLAVLKWQETDPDPIRRVVATEARAAQEDFVSRGAAPSLPSIPEFARLRP